MTDRNKVLNALISCGNHECSNRPTGIAKLGLPDTNLVVPIPESKKFNSCERCKSIKYCSKECQESHSLVHKESCDRFAKILFNERKLRKAHTLAATVAKICESQILKFIEDEIKSKRIKIDGKVFTGSQKEFAKIFTIDIFVYQKISLDVDVEYLTTIIEEESPYLRIAPISTLGEDKRQHLVAKGDGILHACVIIAGISVYVPILDV